MTLTIRPILVDDLPALKNVLDSSKLFPSELLDDMIADYLNNEESRDIWFTALRESQPISIAYCAPERMTEGTYNLYAIAVHKDHQNQGVGKEMMAYLETLLQKQGSRVLLVETSGLQEYERTRKFYDNCGYCREAKIRDFYSSGDDKIVFWKSLG